MAQTRGRGTNRETQTERFGFKMTASLRDELEAFAAEHNVDMSDVLREGAAFIMSGKTPESMSLLKCTTKACNDLLGPDSFVVRLSPETQQGLHMKAESMGMDAAQLLRQLAKVTAEKSKAQIVEYTVGAGWRAAMDVDPQVEIQGGDTKRKHQRAS